MFNADADSLRRIMEECAVLYTQAKEALGELNAQDPWMEIFAMGPDMSDDEIHDHLSPTMNPLVDWLHQRLTPEEKVNGANSHLEMLKVN